MSSVSWHPSGDTINVMGSAGTEGLRYEHWIMENFLPPQETGQSQMAVRRVWTAGGTLATATGAPSRDGRFLPYYDGIAGDVSIHDFSTGLSRRLNLKKGDWTTSDEEASNPVLSPASRKIAYSWLNKDQFYELRVRIDSSKITLLGNRCLIENHTSC